MNDNRSISDDEKSSSHHSSVKEDIVDDHLFFRQRSIAEEIAYDTSFIPSSVNSSFNADDVSPVNGNNHKSTSFMTTDAAAWFDCQFHDEGKTQIKKPAELENEMKDPPEEASEEILNRVQGSIFGMALGDALGAHVEFRPRDYLVEHPVEDLQGGGTWGLAIGQFTDDTSMALCLANSLIARGDFVPYDQLVRYKWWFQKGYMSSTGECFDIGAATRNSIEEFITRQKILAEQQHLSDEQIDFLSNDDLLRQFDVLCSTEGVAGNGALMRLAPVPLFFYERPQDAVLFSGVSGIITHGDVKAYDACRYYGALIVAALHGQTKEELLDPNFYERHKDWFKGKELHKDVMDIAQGSFKKVNGYDGGIRGKGYVINALEAALWAFWADDNSFQKGACDAVNLGDDTDTTAAIYGQLAGAYYGYENLPLEWIEKVYAKEFLAKISKWIVYEGQRWAASAQSNLSSQQWQSRLQEHLLPFRKPDIYIEPPSSTSSSRSSEESLFTPDECKPSFEGSIASSESSQSSTEEQDVSTVETRASTQEPETSSTDLQLETDQPETSTQSSTASNQPEAPQQQVKTSSESSTLPQQEPQQPAPESPRSPVHSSRSPDDTKPSQQQSQTFNFSSIEPQSSQQQARASSESSALPQQEPRPPTPGSPRSPTHSSSSSDDTTPPQQQPQASSKSFTFPEQELRPSGSPVHSNSSSDDTKSSQQQAPASSESSTIPQQEPRSPTPEPPSSSNKSLPSLDEIESLKQQSQATSNFVTEELSTTTTKEPQASSRTSNLRSNLSTEEPRVLSASIKFASVEPSSTVNPPPTENQSARIDLSSKKLQPSNQEPPVMSSSLHRPSEGSYSSISFNSSFNDFQTSKPEPRVSSINLDRRSEQYRPLDPPLQSRSTNSNRYSEESQFRSDRFSPFAQDYPSRREEPRPSTGPFKAQSVSPPREEHIYSYPMTLPVYYDDSIRTETYHESTTKRTIRPTPSTYRSSSTHYGNDGRQQDSYVNGTSFSSSAFRNTSSTSKPLYQGKNLAKWTNSDVCYWIESLGMNFKSYADRFRKEGIDGYGVFAYVGRKTLNDFGIYNEEHQQKILEGIQMLKSRLAASY